MQGLLARFRPTAAATACVLLLAAGTPQRQEAAGAPEPEASDLGDSTPLNHLQVLGTHNSYALGVDPRIAALLDARLPSTAKLLSLLPLDKRREIALAHPNDVLFSEALNFRHPSLTQQLDLGVRALELDVHPDPKGGAYADPAAYRLLRTQGINDLLPFDAAALAAPGLKVLHMADVDVRSSCPTFRQCLAELKAWSNAHQRHIPIFVMIEAKVEALPLRPGTSPVPPFTLQDYAEIEDAIRTVIGRDHLVTPDDVRGSHATLEEAVFAAHWPTLGQARGKFVFLLMTATGHDGADAYLRGHPNLEGRSAFLDSQPGQPHAAFILDDNALARGAEIRREVARGYMVRTRADIDTYEAKINDSTRADAAVASGAQIVSTDFEQPGNAYGTSYVVRLPGRGPARLTPSAR